MDEQQKILIKDGFICLAILIIIIYLFYSINSYSKNIYVENNQNGFNYCNNYAYNKSCSMTLYHNYNKENKILCELKNCFGWLGKE